MLGGLGPPPTDGLADPGAQVRFLEAIEALLAGAVEAGLGVVFVDDLQWCDPASLEALAFLARRLPLRPLLLLGACRTD